MAQQAMVEDDENEEKSLAQQAIVEDYENEEKSWAFGSIATVHRAFPQLSRAQVKAALAQVDTYTRFHPYRKSRKFIPYYVRAKRYLLQADICYMGKQYAKANAGYYMMLVVIDVFTKFVWVRKVRSAGAVHIVPAMRDIFTTMEPHLPKYVQTDRGAEFINQSFAALCREKGVKHYYATSDRKAAVVERSNLTLQRLLYKMMEAKNDNEWIKLIDPMLKLYHNSRHRTIKMTPIEAEQPRNQALLRETYEAQWRRQDSRKKAPKFKVGDTVRISASNLQKFRRGYHAPQSVQYFLVHEVLDNFYIPRYKLREHNKREPMAENFWEDEMVRYNPPPDKAWRIEYIDREQIKNEGTSREMIKVKFVGFPDEEWVLKSSVEDLL